MSHLKKALLLLALLPIAGCGLGNVMAVACAVQGDNADHCWQTVAVQEADPAGCEKVTGKDFVGQNPPRDKCYLMIAENTGDYATCKDIQGGFTSYTPEECVTDIVVKNADPDGCKSLPPGPPVDACLKAFSDSISADKLKDINDQVEKAKSEAGADPNDKDAQDRLKKLLAQQATLFGNAPEASKSTFMKNAREAVLANVDDADVKAEIVKQTLAIRDANPGMSLNDQLKKLQEIKDQQETVKNLDDQANTLMDTLKNSATDAATDKLKEIAADQGKAYLEAHGGEKLKQGIAELEGLKEKYDKASEQYQKISEQLDKVKKVYDELNEVYGKVDEVNKLVAEGKVDQGRAGVLKGAIYLSKGLEYATKYVPVFGSTASTVTKATFDATVKFATSRAARTTAIDKCIDDPEHCDPSGITPY